MVRAKFYVYSITNGKGWAIIKLVPVSTGSEENKTFWQATPTGELTMNVNNPEVVKLFEVGQEFYIDFTPAP